MRSKKPCKTCGHGKSKHHVGNSRTICDSCLDDGLINGRWRKAVHPFILDNLKYLEALSEQKEI